MWEKRDWLQELDTLPLVFQPGWQNTYVLHRTPTIPQMNLRVKGKIEKKKKKTLTTELNVILSKMFFRRKIIENFYCNG